MAALQKQRKDLAKEITDETERLLADRALKLSALEDETEAKLAPLKAELAGVQRQVAEAKEALVEPQATLTGLLGEISHLQKRKADINDQLAALKVMVDDKEQAKSGLEAKNQYLHDQIEPLKSEISDLTAKKAMLIQENSDLITRNNDLQEKITADKANAEYSVGELLAKRDELMVWLAQSEANMKIALESIGKRQLTQDAQAEALRQQKLQNTQDLRRIAQNANLLNL